MSTTEAIKDAVTVLNDFIAVAGAIRSCISGGTDAEVNKLRETIVSLVFDLRGITKTPPFTAVATVFGLGTSMSDLESDGEAFAKYYKFNTPLQNASALSGIISDFAGIAQGVAEVADVAAAATGQEAEAVPLTGFIAACAAVKSAATLAQFAIDLSEGYFGVITTPGINLGPVNDFTKDLAWDIKDLDWSQAGYTVDPSTFGGNLSATVRNSGSGYVYLSESPGQPLMADISGNIGGYIGTDGNPGISMAHVNEANVTVEPGTTGTISCTDNQTISIGDGAQIAINGVDNTITAGKEDAITAYVSNITVPSDTQIVLTGSQLTVYGTNSFGTTNATLFFQECKDTQVSNPGDGGMVAYNVPNPNGSGTITINGTPVPVPGLGMGIDVLDIACAPGVSPDQVIADLVTQLGDPLTVAQWDQDYINYLNPTGTAYTVGGSVAANADNASATVTYAVGGAPGAVAAGQSTAQIEITEYYNGQEQNVAATVAATNVLDASGDISQDTITGMQQMAMNGNVTLNGTEWNEVSSITGNGSVTFTSAGSFSAAGTGATITAMTAQAWGGTTLIGSSQNGQVLTASLFGNDTLNAGSGAGDTLVAGQGADTLIGSSAGGTTFKVLNSLAAGTSITGNGSGNILLANGTDISGATITGVQTLNASEIALNAEELAELSTINLGSFDIASGDTSRFILNARGAGTFSTAGITFSGTNATTGAPIVMNPVIDMIADATDDETLIAGDRAYGFLSAANSSGNDTLTAGNGSNDMLDADGSSGNNTLTAGNGGGDNLYDPSFYNDEVEGDYLSAQDSSGNNILTAGGGSCDTLDVDGSSGNNRLTAGNGANDQLTADDSSGNNTLIAGNGVGNYLSVSGSSGNNTLTGGGGGNDMDATGSTGTNIFNGGSGGNAMYAGAGISIMTGGSGHNAFYVDDGLAAGSSITGNGADNTLYFNVTGNENINDAAITGMQTVYFSPGASVTMDASALSDLCTCGLWNVDGDDPSAGVPTTIIASGAGVYSLASANINDNSDLILAANPTASVTLDAADQDGVILSAANSTGNDTLISNGSDTIFEIGAGVDTITDTGGGGLFIIDSTPAAGTTITASGSINAVAVSATDISPASINVTGSLMLEDQSPTLMLTGDEFNQFNALENTSGKTETLLVVGDGSYSLNGWEPLSWPDEDEPGIKTMYGNFVVETVAPGGGSTIAGDSQNNETLEMASGDWTLIAGSGNGDTLIAGSGTDTLIGGSGSDTFVNGSGAATMEGGSGTNTFVISGAPAAGIAIEGGTGTNILQTSGDITGLSITNVQTLEADSVTLTLAEFNSFTAIDTSGGATTGSGAITAADGGTWNLSGKSTVAFDMVANSDDGTTLIGDNADTETLTASASGTDTLEAGNGNGDVLAAGGGNDTLIAGSGADTLEAGSGTDTLIGGSGSDTFVNGSGAATMEGGSGTNTFVISGTPAAGITIEGGTGTNILQASGDITGIGVSGVQTLEVNGSATLTNAEFGGFGTISGSNSTIYAANAGTYNLGGKTASGIASLSAAGTSANLTLTGDNEAGQTLTGGSGNDTLTAGNGAGDALYAGSGNTTLVAGTGGDTLYDGSGVDALRGGSGNDTFYIDHGTLGTTVTGGGGNGTLVAGTDISGITFSGIQTLEVNGNVTLTAGQFGEFSTLTGNGTINASGGGAYNLAGLNATGSFNLSAGGDASNVTLTGNNQTGQTLTGGSGTDTLIAGNGAGDVLVAGTGVDTLEGGTGGDTFEVNGTLASGTTITGQGAGNTLYGCGDISGATITGVQTLEVNGNVTLTAGQLSEFSNLTGTGTIEVSGGGAYNLAGLNATGNFNLSAASDASNVTLTGDNEAGQTLTGGSGTDTLIAGNGAGDVLVAGSGNTTLVAGSGGDTLYDGSGVDALEGGSGNDTFYINHGTLGTTVTGGGGSDTLVAGTDISGITFSGIQTLEVNGSATLTNAEFAGFSTIAGSNSTIYAADAGTYNLGGKTASGIAALSAANTGANVTLIGDNEAGQTLTAGSGTDTLIAGNGAGDVLNGGSGTSTLIGGSGNDTFYGSTGVDTMTGGSGSNIFVVNGTLASGSSITGGSGTNVIQATYADISGGTILGVSTLAVTGSVTLTASQMAGFTSLQAQNGYASLDAANGGTYNLAAVNSTDEFDMVAQSNAGTTLIGNGAAQETLTASASGTDTLQAGSGTDILYAGGGNDTLIGGSGADTFESGTGVDTMTGGSGSNIFVVNGTLASGSTITGGTGTNILEVSNANITGDTITGVSTLAVAGSITLTASQLASFTSLQATNGYASLYAASGGTYNLAAVNSTDEFDMVAESNAGTTLIGNGAAQETLTASTSGTDTLEAGSGTDILYAGGGNDTLIGGSGADTFESGAGVDTMTGGSGSNIFVVSGTLASGSTITGGTGTNVLEASNANISGDAITGVPTLAVTNSVTLNASQLASFTSLQLAAGSYASLYAANGGTYNLAAVNSGAEFDMVAQSNAGTTLIGNGASVEWLTASASGNDTLQAGSGTDTLFAGGGNDTLIGGSGADTFESGTGVDTMTGGSGSNIFVVSGTLASGSSITGGSGTNVIQASNANITGGTITGVSTLAVTNSVTLNASQLTSFTSLQLAAGSYAALYAASAGTYNLTAVNSTSEFDMVAESNAGTTLIGNGASVEWLTASASGNDTLHAGSGADTLFAGGSNDTLIGGTGADTFESGTGVDAMTGGSGSNIFVVSGTLASGSTITGGTGTNVIQAIGANITGDTITGVPTLAVAGSITLNASQLASFTSLQLMSGSYASLYAANGGTYNLAAVNSASEFDMVAQSNAGTTLIGNGASGEYLTASASGTDTLTSGNGARDVLYAGSGTDTLTSGSGAGDVLYAGSGTDTLTAGNGAGDILVAGSGVDTMKGGTGGDTFEVYGTFASGSKITGQGTGNTLSAYGDISGGTVTGVQTLSIYGSWENLTLTNAEFTGFTTINGNGSILYTANAGTYNLGSKTASGIAEISAAYTSANVTLTGDSEAGQILIAGSGTDTLTSGSGAGDVLYAGSGTDTLTAGNGAGDILVASTGVDTIKGGTGGDTFEVYGTFASGSKITGQGTGNTLSAYGNISGGTVTGVQTLSIYGSWQSVTLTNAEFTGFTTINGNGSTLYVTNAGTYNLGGKTASGIAEISSSGISANVTLTGDNEASQTLIAGSGTDTLTAGSGAGDMLYAGSGTDTLTAGSGNGDILYASTGADTLKAGAGNDTLVTGTGNDTLYGSTGTNTYDFGSAFGTADKLYNAGANSAAAGTIAFTASSTTDENLWFVKSGNNLLIDLLGTTDQITVENWYTSAGNQVSSVTAGGETMLNSQFAALVSAMAAYQSAHSSFNAQTATSMPTDTTLQNAIAASWH